METATLKVKTLMASENNPRKESGDAGMAELTQSIKETGVITPILVRPRDVAGNRYQIVAGHRRTAAAIKAGLEEIPAMIKNLTDEEVAEIQMVENLQREDLHPLDEAVGYKRLVVEYGADIPELAEKVGKSESYVRKRLVLCRLVEPGKKLLRKGKISLVSAMSIARMPEDQDQLRVVKKLKSIHWWGESDVRHHIEEHYMLMLRKAPFSTKSTELRKDGRDCGSCDLRTGSEPSLFDDLDVGDRCLNPECFHAKTKEHGRQMLEKAKKQKLEVVTDAFDKDGYMDREKYVDLGDRDGSIGMSWQKALRGQKVEVVVTVDEKGAFRKLAKIGSVRKALKANKIRPFYGQFAVGTSTRTSDADRKRTARAKAIEKRYAELVGPLVKRRVETTTKIDAKMLRVIAARLQETVMFKDQDVRRMAGFNKRVSVYIEKAPPAQLAKVIVAMMAAPWGGPADVREELLEAWDIKAKVIKKQAAKEVDAEAKKPAKKKAKSGRRGMIKGGRNT